MKMRGRRSGRAALGATGVQEATGVEATIAGVEAEATTAEIGAGVGVGVAVEAGVMIAETGGAAEVLARRATEGPVEAGQGVEAEVHQGIEVIAINITFILPSIGAPCTH